MGREVFELAILISLKDAASGQLDRVGDRLRAMGKDGRAALKDLQDLRADLRKGIELGGIGVAGLGVLKGGMEKAADLEDALGNLKGSIATVGKDGSLNVAKLNDQMERFRSLTMDMGSKLPGTEKDFVAMFTALKEGGLQTEAVLNGAGKAVGELAIATRLNPAELGKQFAQVGEMYQLKPEEYDKATNIFAKLTSVGLTPEQLIEGGKFAQIRAGGPLRMSGISGLEQMSNMLGVMRASGLEGGIGGRELGAMLMNLAVTRKAQKKADAELKSKFGVQLDFFDKKTGDFLGGENLAKQFEKLRGLKPEELMAFLEKRFGGRESAGPANVFMKLGLEGWEKYKQRVDEAADRQQKLAFQTEKWNAKVQNVLGTLSNVEAVTFTPLLDTLKPVLDTTNNILGSLQEFSKEHQTLAAIATDFVGIGSAVLVVAGAVKVMTAAWGLWKIATSLGSRGGLLQYLGAVKTETAAVSTALETESSAAQSASYQLGYGMGDKLGRGLGAGSRIAGKIALGAALAAIPIEMFVSGLMKRAQEAADARSAGYEVERLEDSRAKLLKLQENGGKDQFGNVTPPEVLKGQLGQIDKQIGEAKVRAAEALGTKDSMFGSNSEFASNVRVMNKGALGMVTGEVGFGEYFKRWSGFAGPPEGSAREQGSDILKKQGFDSKEQLAAFLMGIRESGKYTNEELGSIKQIAEQAYPSYMKELEGLDGKTHMAAEGFDDFYGSLSRVIPVLDEIGGGNGKTGQDGKPLTLKTIKPDHRAMGGDVGSEGLVYVHAGERILPASVTRGLRGSGGAGAGSYIGHKGDIHVHIHVPAGSPAANDSKALAAMVASEVRRQRERR